MASRSKFLHRYRRRLMCPCCQPEDDLRRWLKRRRRREGMTEKCEVVPTDFAPEFRDRYEWLKESKD